MKYLHNLRKAWGLTQFDPAFQQKKNAKTRNAKGSNRGRDKSIYAIEFRAKIKDGMIEIPQEYRNKLKENIKVIILVEEKETTLIDQLLNSPFLKLKTSNHFLEKKPMSINKDSQKSCFVDTNQSIIQKGEIVVSTQIINEVCFNLLKKASFPEEQIEELIGSLLREIRGCRAKQRNLNKNL